MNTTQDAKKLITEFRSKHSASLEKIPAASEKLREVCGKIQQTWSGSFAGWHGNMYFRDFQIPTICEQFNGEWGGVGINGIPDGWEEKKPEEVRAKIEKSFGDNFSVKNFEDEIKTLRKEAGALKNEITITFSAFPFDTNTEKEKGLFAQIENYEFGKSKGEFIRNELPKTMMSRDTEALRQGICIASWLYYTGVALEGESLSEAINNFLGLVDRLVRQLEIKKTNVAATASISSDKLSYLHSEIYNKCHSLYEKGEYAEAVEKGFKVVRDKLRKLTGHETGSEAFGKGKLHIKGAAAANVDKDFNEAVKFLTMAIDRFRNEKSHTSDAKIDDPVRAYEYLRLSSLAMNLLEDAEILP